MSENEPDEIHECICCGHKGPEDEFNSLIEEPVCHVCAAAHKADMRREQADFFKSIGGRPAWRQEAIGEVIVAELNGARRTETRWGYKTEDGRFYLTSEEFSWFVRAGAVEGDRVCEFSEPLEAGVLKQNLLPEYALT